MPAHFQKAAGLETDLKAAIRQFLEHLPGMEEKLTRISYRATGKTPDHPPGWFLIDPEGSLGKLLKGDRRIAHEPHLQHFCTLDFRQAVHAQERAPFAARFVGNEIMAAAEQDAVGLHLNLRGVVAA